MTIAIAAALFLAAGAGSSPAPKQVVSYTLTVDAADLSGYGVEMRLHDLPDTATLAMAAHPEYDDRFWRYVTDIRVEGGSIQRVDSALWRLVRRGREVVVRYRIALPEESRPRAAWRPFLSPGGGLVGGPHSFMYVVGRTPGMSEVRFRLPEGWRIATGLRPTRDPGTFFAPTVEALMESPALVGRFRDWSFGVDGVPHRVVYWGDAAFDTATFVRQIEGLSREAVRLFGTTPYPDYTFIYQDSALGGLEHPNSVTLGAPSARLGQSVSAFLESTAHEFIHTWNLMRIRPEEYGPVTHLTQRPTAGLWFSEGLTMMYADLLPRRAGLPTPDSSRIGHLEELIERYLSQPGNARFSAEQVSRVEYNTTPGALGDYTASPHLLGELLGTMLDLVIRDATDGRRSMDDVMRLMLARFSGERGFNGRDVEQAVEDVCGCEVTPFFDAHVRGAGPIDFERYLALAGLRLEVARAPAVEREGRPAVDLRAWGRETPDGLILVVSDPESSWGRAGLHTGDRIVSINGTALRTWPELRRVLVQARIGDSMTVEVMRPAGPFRATVEVAGFERPTVRITPIEGVALGVAAIREAWLGGR